MLSHLARIACILTILVAPRYVIADEGSNSDDLVAKIATCLPEAWKVSLASDNRALVVRINTAPMETRPSHYSNAKDKGERQPVTITLQVLPKHSPAMLRRIREHNEPLVTRLKTIPYRTNEKERRELAARMIPCPIFQDGQYGYIVVPPERVPERVEDFRILQDVLRKVCAGWEPVGKGGPTVRDIPEYFNYR